MTTPTLSDDSIRDDLFNDSLERLLAGDMSGLNVIEPDLRETVLEMTNLARTAGWLEATDTPPNPMLTPSGVIPVRDGDGRDGGRSATRRGSLRRVSRSTGGREELMQQAGTAIPEPPMSRRRAAQQRAIRTQRLPLSRMVWSNAASVALAILIMIASFGAWRIIDGGSGNGGNVPGANEGTYARAPMTPVPVATEELGEALTACDFSDETPIYNGVDVPPVKGTVLYVTTSNDLMIRCDEEPEDILLASDVDSANALGWPGVLAIAIGAGDYSPTPMLFNMLTGEMVEFDFTEPPMTLAIEMSRTGQSPFVVTAQPDGGSSWMVTDVRSMESRTLDDLGGVEWPTYSSIAPSDNGAQGTLAVAMYNPDYATIGEPALDTPEGMPGEILVLSGSLDNAIWIDLPENFAFPRTMQVSPDGEHIAVLGQDGSTDPGSASIAIFSTSDGSEIARTDTFEYEDSPEMVWVQDGGALVYTQPLSGTLMKLDPSPDATSEALVETPGRLFALSAGSNPDLVIVSEVASLEETWMRQSDLVYSINTRTGDMRTFDGPSWQPGSVFGTRPQTQAVIIMAAPPESGEDLTRIIDPTTGRTILELPAALIENPAWQMGVTPDGVTFSGDGYTTAFTVEHRALVVVDATGDVPTAREVAFPSSITPEGDWSTELRLSPDGSSLQLSIFNELVHMQWVLDLSDSGAPWIEIPEGAWLEFMPAVP